MTRIDREWVGRTLFVAKGKLTSSLKLWWHPPPVENKPTSLNPDSYHTLRLSLWMTWKVNFHCPQSGVKESLRSKGLHNRVCSVLDVKDQYYMSAEYTDCRGCSGTFVAWDHSMLSQLANGVRALFPAILTMEVRL